MIATLQTQLQALLEAHPWFAGVDILSEEKGDLQNEIDTAVKSIGFCIVLITPQGQLEADKGGRLWMRHNLSINAVESYTINQTGKRAKAAVVPIIEAIHDHWNGLGNADSRGRNNLLHCRGYEIVPDPDGLTVYAVAATTLSTLTATDNE